MRLVIPAIWATVFAVAAIVIVNNLIVMLGRVIR